MAGDVDTDDIPPPQQTTVLFGHGEAERFLADAYRSGRMHHAILIQGPEGVGKATLAFRFARHVLSHPDPANAPEAIADADPESAVYRQILGGASHNLVHLARAVDEKTGRRKMSISVDDVRKAGRFMAQTSGGDSWRIVIVDTADDLQRSAANAILKILEEPPKRALFLMLSHASGRLLPTIRSRCLPLRLQPLAPADLALGLAHFGKGEAEEGAERIAATIARAEGSLGRALMLLGAGGLDIATAFEAAIAAGPDRATRDIHRLAEAVTARDRDDAYAFFQAAAVDWLARQAGEAALSGDSRAADRIADAVSKLEETFSTAGAYNLDKRQTVIGTFSTVFSAIRS